MSENRILKTEVYKKEDLQARNEMVITVDLNDSNYRASTVAIGSVSTGPVPSVTNAGTPSAAIFDFVLPKGDPGEPGQPGAKGDPGVAGQNSTIEIGTVTPGTEAKVVNRGTPSAAILDFTLPVTTTSGGTVIPGPKGDTGANGESAYEIAKRLNLTTATSESDFIASLKGEQGPAGQPGERGADGATGIQASEVYSRVDSDDKYATKAMIPVTYNKTQLDSMISALSTGGAGGAVVSGSTSVYKEFESGKFPVLLPGATAPVNPDLSIAPGAEALVGNNRWFKYTFKKAFSEVPVIQITTEVGALGTNPSLTLIGEVTKEYFTFKNNWYGAAIRINYSAFVPRPASEVAAGGTSSGGTTVTLGSTFTEEEERKLKDIVINGVPSGGGSGTAAPVTPVFSDATDLTVLSSMHNRTVGLTATGTVTINLSSVPSGTSFKFLNVGSTKNVTFTGKTIIGQSAMNGDKGSYAEVLVHEGDAYITTHIVNTVNGGRFLE